MPTQDPAGRLIEASSILVVFPRFLSSAYSPSYNGCRGYRQSQPRSGLSAHGRQSGPFSSHLSARLGLTQSAFRHADGGPPGTPWAKHLELGFPDTPFPCSAAVIKRSIAVPHALVSPSWFCVLGFPNKRKKKSVTHLLTYT